MRTLYFFSVWLHILAATVWIGGMFFLLLVVVPWLRSGARVEAGLLLRETAGRFRSVAWACFTILIATGTINLWVRGVSPRDFVSPDWLASSFGSALIAKLFLFAIVLFLSGYHDFIVGPRAVDAIRNDPRSPEAERLRRQASLHGRANSLLSLMIVALAVALVRGWPW